MGSSVPDSPRGVWFWRAVARVTPGAPPAAGAWRGAPSWRRGAAGWGEEQAELEEMSQNWEFPAAAKRLSHWLPLGFCASGVCAVKGPCGLSVTSTSHASAAVRQSSRQLFPSTSSSLLRLRTGREKLSRTVSLFFSFSISLFGLLFAVRGEQLLPAGGNPQQGGDCKAHASPCLCFSASCLMIYC